MQEISFLHIADLHLGRPFAGLNHLEKNIFERIQNSTFESFKTIIDTALEKRVDFILIAGDLFDHAHRNLKAQLFLRNQLERLKETGAQAFIIHGNHDHLGGSFQNLQWPSHIHIFESEEVEAKPFYKDDVHLANIYGFSYKQAAVTDKKINSYRREGNVPFHIGMLHGSMDGASEHATYAPFSLTELLDTGMDYFALGHIHKQQIIKNQPPIIYSGNIQGLSRKEEGPKGCVFVRLGDTVPHVEPISTSKLEWKNLYFSISELNELDDFLKAVSRVKEELSSDKSYLLVLHLSGERKAWVPGDKSGWDELLETLNEEEGSDSNFICITEINNLTTSPLSEIHKKSRDAFYQELIQAGEEEGCFQDSLKEVFKKKQVKSLFNVEEFESEVIRREALERIFVHLNGGGKL